jgi:hypothetical protein
MYKKLSCYIPCWGEGRREAASGKLTDTSGGKCADMLPALCCIWRKWPSGIRPVVRLKMTVVRDTAPCSLSEAFYRKAAIFMLSSARTTEQWDWCLPEGGCFGVWWGPLWLDVLCVPMYLASIMVILMDGDRAGCAAGKRENWTIRPAAVRCCYLARWAVDPRRELPPRAAGAFRTHWKQTFDDAVSAVPTSEITAFIRTPNYKRWRIMRMWRVPEYGNCQRPMILITAIRGTQQI